MDSAGYKVHKPSDKPLQNNSVLSCPQSTRIFALMPYISIQHLREGLFPRPALALSLWAQASGAKALSHEEQKRPMSRAPVAPFSGPVEASSIDRASAGSAKAADQD
ncbi:hypothetical protein Q3G72_018497 [Acer saccharum]|nr:hypothetical protein Q3G72_018497 [Acer saccharum]